MHQFSLRLPVFNLLLLLVVSAGPAAAQQTRQPAAPPKPAAKPAQPAVPPSATKPQPKPAARGKSAPTPAVKEPAPATATPKAKADDTSSTQGETYTLRYKFQTGETLRWRTEHQAHIRTTVKGVTATAESYTESVKVWRVSAVDADGDVTFENSVASVKMRQKHSGSSEIEYDSLTDQDPPPVFAQAAKSIGVPLAVIKMDPRGKILQRDDKRENAQDASLDLSQVAMTLPEQPVSIGDEWHDPIEYKVRGPDGAVHPIKARQLYKLEDVRHGVAVVKLETQILTPVSEPAIEAQLAQKETRGVVRFDVAAGRIVGQQYDLDKPVVNFSGPQSSLHCRTRFTEELLGDGEPTAQREATQPQTAKDQPKS